MGSRYEVSEPVIFDFLLYLPVISLLRFKTVCKSWCSIIESTSFINQHVYRNSENNNAIVSCYDGQLLLINAREHELCLNLNFECMFPKDKLWGLSSCNGIICLGFILSKDYWRVCLWNPATKQVRELPEASYLCSQPSWTATYHTFAIGFDKKTNDYKIVSMSLQCDVKYLVKGSLVQVYNMRSDSWRTIHEGDDFTVCWFDEEKVVCNGEMCLWIVYCFPVCDHALFYFDMVDEVYDVVPLPIYPLESGDNFPAFLSGKIGFISWISEPSSTCSYYEIWMMNEFGVKESWNKVFTLKDTQFQWYDANLVHLSNNGDFILTKKGSDDSFVWYELLLYDLVTGEVKHVGTQMARSITNYFESLVSIKSKSRDEAS